MGFYILIVCSELSVPAAFKMIVGVNYNAVFDIFRAFLPSGSMSIIGQILSVSWITATINKTWLNFEVKTQVVYLSVFEMFFFVANCWLWWSVMMVSYLIWNLCGQKMLHIKNSLVFMSRLRLRSQHDNRRCHSSFPSPTERSFFAMVLMSLLSSSTNSYFNYKFIHSLWINTIVLPK